LDREERLKLVSFVAGGEMRWGAARGDTVIDLNLARAMFLAARGLEVRYLANDALDFIRQGEPALDAANETLEFLGSRVVDGIVFQADAVRLVAPIPNPPKIIAIGLNYHAHQAEQDKYPIPAYPVLFPKFTNSIIGPGEAITWDAALTQQVDYEAELGVVIGQRARNVPANDALGHVFGYCNLNDISARDLQFAEQGAQQWTRGKSLDTFCPIGPYVVTKDEISDPQHLAIRCFLNGELVQDANTSDMVATVAQLIEFISHGITLVPGDIIATGTPPGVGMYQNPPRYLKRGDRVDVQVEGLGRLTNPVE
jgi:2-keto-4-pentenoate hydratase/2-oxohepta-3-ene-1,7-dioic acid hydratase in catechol pathway